MNGQRKIPFVDWDQAQEALNLLIQDEQVFEVRILEPKQNGQRWMPKAIFGYFNDTKKAISSLRRLSLESAKGIYVTLNPVDSSLLARGYNKFTNSKGGDSTSDKNIISRQWLLIDCDPQRPTGISASDDEKEVSHRRALAVQAHLGENGWGDPILADSGNGFHLLYQIKLPAESDLPKRCLEALDQIFSDEKVKIDTSVHNPARIVKLYGTLAAKGDDCSALGRPHRLSKIIEIPENIETVPIQLMEELAGQFDSKSQATTLEVRYQKRESYKWDKDQMQAFIDKHLGECQPKPPQVYENGFKWVLKVCPFSPEHNNSSALITLRNGVPGFKCHHNSCQGNNWKLLQSKYGFDNSTSQNCFVEEDKALIQKYGEPIFYNNRNEPIDVNQQFCASRFAQENLILFDPIINIFYAYDEKSGLWRQKTEGSLIEEIGLMLRDVLSQYGAEKLLRKRTEHLVRQILGFLRGRVEKPNAFDGEKNFIHVGNGMLLLEDLLQTLRTFNSDYLSRNRSEVCFDPKATCSRFLNELLCSALDDDDIALLQKYAGQCLLGRNLSQTILLLRGTPGGGKSTLVNVLEEIIGIFNVIQLRIEHLSDRFEIASYVGKTLLCGKDVPGDFLNHKSAYVLKALVGNDRLNAEQKNVKHRFEIHGRFNVIITSNSRLHVRLDSDAGAWKRRMIIIDYEKPPTEKPNPRFAEELIVNEGPGILNWMIEGAIKLTRELNDLGKIQLTQIQEKRVDDLLSESDSVRQFLHECVVKMEGEAVTVHEITIAYSNFCDARGWQALTVRQFENQLSNAMMEIHRVVKRNDIERGGKKQRGFMHVFLTDPETLITQENL